MCGFFRDSRTNSESFGDKVALVVGVGVGIGLTLAGTFGLGIPVGLLSVGFYMAATFLTEKLVAPVASFFYRKCLSRPLVEQDAHIEHDRRSDHSESDRWCPTF